MCTMLLKLPLLAPLAGVLYKFGVTAFKGSLGVSDWSELRSDHTVCAVSTFEGTLPHVTISPKVRIIVLCLVHVRQEDWRCAHTRTRLEPPRVGIVWCSMSYSRITRRLTHPWEQKILWPTDVENLRR